MARFCAFHCRSFRPAKLEGPVVPLHRLVWDIAKQELLWPQFCASWAPLGPTKHAESHYRVDRLHGHPCGHSCSLSRPCLKISCGRSQGEYPIKESTGPQPETTFLDRSPASRPAIVRSSHCPGLRTSSGLAIRNGHTEFAVTSGPHGMLDPFWFESLLDEAL